MNAGRIIIEGNIGPNVGEFMINSEILCNGKGTQDDNLDIGKSMSGGSKISFTTWDKESVIKNLAENIIFGTVWAKGKRVYPLEIAWEKLGYVSPPIQIDLSDFSSDTIFRFDTRIGKGEGWISIAKSFYSKGNWCKLKSSKDKASKQVTSEKYDANLIKSFPDAAINDYGAGIEYLLNTLISMGDGKIVVEKLNIRSKYMRDDNPLIMKKNIDKYKNLILERSQNYNQAEGEKEVGGFKCLRE